MSSDDLIFSWPPASSRPTVHIALLGGFDLVVNDVPVTVPVGSKRLLAFIALNGRAAAPRSLVAGSLWPEACEQSAYANLRSALSRLRGIGRKALDVCPTEVRLARKVTVDLHHARSLAQRILDPGVPAEDLNINAATVDQLTDDLLPGWYDEWALREAEQWQQLRLHALEALAGAFIDTKQFAGAVAAAHAAVQANPLRESSQASLIRAHLAEGNPSEALDEFERYTHRLRDELGLRPTPRLCHLVDGLQRPGSGW
ncbi:BTAD domain-containing putative transcriptional regulator [Streptomyces sp. DSM 41527]|uniref:BTAD domain-containing putative transcriptional regulator n=1 Tax=Streptomyces mooreae TaxID=3075523 RepID=A0ABU2T1C4_9ACTN|nr:BTAD domain-containing putative transcriptional regulator [Streptomyces sp. DSM 41527]MDT0455036.1 BTAD domain-containing putative transcriptional regulator [Streptomyces sp. DSM 41527]